MASVLRVLRALPTLHGASCSGSSISAFAKEQGQWQPKQELVNRRQKLFEVARTGRLTEDCEL